MADTYSIDSRTIKPGDVFIPYKGKNFDGHKFISDALKNGASKILYVDIQQFALEHRLKFNIPIIGITGSSGKTTTKDLLFSVLSEKFSVHRTLENHNNEVGVPLTILGINSDTDIAIIELGARNFDDINSLASIVLPTHSIITNIGYAHLESFGSQENIALAKSEIFNIFQNSPSKRFAFIPDNLIYRDIILDKARKNNFSVINVPYSSLTQENIHTAFAVGYHFNLSDEQIKSGIKKFVPSSNRMNVLIINKRTLINDTYNANFNSMVYALQKFDEEYTSGRNIAVLGDMLELGKKEVVLHELLGKNMNVSKLYTLGSLSQYINPEGVTVKHYLNKEYLIKDLFDELRPGDNVLFKASRGMKLEVVVDALLESYS